MIVKKKYKKVKLSYGKKNILTSKKKNDLQMIKMWQKMRE